MVRFLQREVKGKTSITVVPLYLSKLVTLKVHKKLLYVYDSHFLWYIFRNCNIGLQMLKYG